MSNIKVSIITVVQNRVNVIAHAISSIQDQDYSNIEHVIIDGASTDGTLETIRQLIGAKTILISEPDGGIYDALNKGIVNSSGDVIGVLHSDDFFSDRLVISQVSKLFEDPTVDIVYGDLDYVSNTDSRKIVRHWVAGEFSEKKLSWGWMPPHPAVFIRRSFVELHGAYNTSYQISGDYDSLLRYFGVGKAKVSYLKRVLVKMSFGGKSNESFKRIIRKMTEDYRALRYNKIGGIGALFWKNIRKLEQFILW
jgi:glycosyltransferase involved in cell wall biosynthesis